MRTRQSSEKKSKYIKIDSASVTLLILFIGFLAYFVGAYLQKCVLK